MSLTVSDRAVPAGQTAPAAPARPARRVRHHVRDGVAVMALSATLSCGLAVALMAFLSVVG